MNGLDSTTREGKGRWEERETKGREKSLQGECRSAEDDSTRRRGSPVEATVPPGLCACCLSAVYGTRPCSGRPSLKPRNCQAKSSNFQPEQHERGVRKSMANGIGLPLSPRDGSNDSDCYYAPCPLLFWPDA
jgi:hypothetical protein